VETVSKEKRNRQEWRRFLVLLKGKLGVAIMNRYRKMEKESPSKKSSEIFF
jgi:hypothetical protein